MDSVFAPVNAEGNETASAPEPKKQNYSRDQPGTHTWKRNIAFNYKNEFQISIYFWQKSFSKRFGSAWKSFLPT